MKRLDLGVILICVVVFGFSGVSVFRYGRAYARDWYQMRRATEAFAPMVQSIDRKAFSPGPVAPPYVIWDLPRHRVHEAHLVLQLELRATQPSDVRTVVLVQECKEERTGWHRGTLWEHYTSCSVEAFDLVERSSAEFEVRSDSASYGLDENWVPYEVIDRLGSRIPFPRPVTH